MKILLNKQKNIYFGQNSSFFEQCIIIILLLYINISSYVQFLMQPLFQFQTSQQLINLIINHNLANCQFENMSSINCSVYKLRLNWYKHIDSNVCLLQVQLWLVSVGTTPSYSNIMQGLNQDKVIVPTFDSSFSHPF